MRVARITDTAGFAALHEEWNALARRVAPDRAASRFDWHDAAWCWDSERARLNVLTVHRDEQLVGIAPLVRDQTRLAGLPMQRLRFLSVPDMPYSDFIASPDDLPAVSHAI